MFPAWNCQRGIRGVAAFAGTWFYRWQQAFSWEAMTANQGRYPSLLVGSYNQPKDHGTPMECNTQTDHPKHQADNQKAMGCLLNDFAVGAMPESRKLWRLSNRASGKVESSWIQGSPPESIIQKNTCEVVRNFLIPILRGVLGPKVVDVRWDTSIADLS